MKKIILLLSCVTLLSCEKKKNDSEPQNQAQATSTTTGSNPNTPTVYTVSIFAKNYSVYGNISVDWNYPSISFGTTYTTQTISISDTTSSDSIAVQYSCLNTFSPNAVYGNNDVTVQVNGAIKAQVINVPAGTLKVKVH
jgi:hypothetical protein